MWFAFFDFHSLSVGQCLQEKSELEVKLVT